MAQLPTLDTKLFETYRGIEIYFCNAKFYAARCGAEICTSHDIDGVRLYIDTWFWSRRN